MANYQWRKYRVEYEPSYKLVKDDYYGYGSFKYLTHDRVNTGCEANQYGNIELTNSKNAADVREGDVIYAYKTSGDGNLILTSNYSGYDIYDRSHVYKIIARGRMSDHSTDNHYDGRLFALDSDNSYLDGVYSVKESSGGARRGSYIGTVQGDQWEYPSDGEKDGYWYVYDRALNSAPVIYAYNTRIGVVRSDFDIRYRVVDEDGDRVRVQIMVDDRVIQYPMETSLDREQTVRIRLDDYSLGDHTITVTATDSSNASDSVTYYFTKSNQAPSISGSDLDLGGVFKDVSVDYIVQDADGDSVEVKISLDGVVKQAFTKTSLGVRRTFNLPIKSVSLGRHRLVIEARDSQGASSTRTYRFEKVNSAPVISGHDVNLGAKNTAFSYSYTVKDNEGDKVKVVEKLNGSIIRTLYNISLGQEQTITISDEQIKAMELHKQNTIEIEASDGTATVYRRVNFTRNNMPPIISDQDRDLGELTEKFEYKFSATDPEEDKMVYTVSLDDRILTDREPIADGREKTILIDGFDWIKVRPTKHTIKIIVEDDKGFKSTRTITFTRRVDRIIVQLAEKGIATDAIASRVLISDAGIYSARGTITKLEACNNSFDDKPTWEDATTMFKAGRAYTFQNKAKTATKAGVNIRVTIGKGESTAPSYITATGGSFD